MKRRVISVFMVFVLTICTVFSTGFANAKSVETQLTTGSSELKRLEASGQLAVLKELKASIAKGINYKADDEVVIVVELEDKTLLEYADKDQDPADFAASSKGKKTRKSILDKHDEVKETIKETAHNVSYDDSYEYTVIMNGFTVKAKYGDLKTINEISGVKRAYVAGYYEKPATEKSTETNMAYSTVTIGSNTVNAEGYTGEGVAVAVLDTGLDYTHEAFAIQPNEVKYTVDEMNEIIAANGISGTAYNNKVIYTYDYADRDINVMPTEGNEHGTHVSGTIAGYNGEDFTGVAPDAQLMMMKVFSDTDDGASDDVILAALEDAVTLGADVINMSLGSSCGFTEGSDEATKDIYNRVEEAGISLMISAGNSYYQGYNITNTNVPYADTPDYGVVGSPSTYDAALSVASIENVKITSNCFTVNGNKYGYTDNGPSDKKLITLAGNTYEYVYAGLGSDEECKAANVQGKVALIKRGSLAFTNKVANAYNNGAVAVIIFNNAAGTISMSVENYYIPAVSITQADGEAMQNTAVKNVTFTDEMLVSENPLAGEMSDFSSWGVTPSLTLKPEITAPGGEIYSTMPGNKYASMSGTSMAAPHMAGAAAVLRQYVNETFDMNNTEERDFINNVLMSTADPAVESEDESGISYYSPRKQGAGLVNVNDAIKSGAYLYTGDSDRPKAELGDSVDGEYDFTFQIKNYSDESKVYDLSYIMQTDCPASYKGDFYNILSSMTFDTEDADVDIMLNGQEVSSVTVLPGEAMELEVAIDLDDNTIEALNQYFSNGFYVDGYLFLDSEENVEDLSMPMMGFCGDWDSLQLYDGTVYDGDYYYYGSSVGGYFNYEDSVYSDVLGENYFTGNLDKNNIAYSKNRIRNEYGIDTDAYLTTDIGLLRNASDVTYTITNSAGEVVDTHAYYYDNCEKTFYYSNGGYVTSMTDLEFMYGDFDGTQLPDGDYTVTIEAYAAEGDQLQTVSYDFYVDNRSPRIIKAAYTESSDGALLLNAKVVDNRMVQGVKLYMVLQSEEGTVIGIDTSDMENYTNTLYTYGYIDEAACNSMLALIPKAVMNDDGQVLDWDITGYKEFAEMFAPYTELIYGEGYTLDTENIAEAAVDYAWNISEYNVVSAVKPAGDITITVMDQTKKGIEGAVVEINGAEYTTDNNGTIELLNMALGTYTAKLISVPEGYKMSNGASFRIILSKDGDAASRTFKVTSSNTIKGKSRNMSK